MNYLILILLIFISLKIIEKTNCIYLVYASIKSMRRAMNLIMNKKISDHWKEKIIPTYSLGTMKSSLSLLLVFLVIILLFYLVGFLNPEFIEFIFSIKAILISFFSALTYSCLKKFIKR